MRKLKVTISNLNKIEEDLLLEYNKILNDEEELSKSIKKLKVKIKDLKNEFLLASSKRKEILNKIKSENMRVLTSCSVVFDKRWNSYICIFKNSKSQKSIYLGKHEALLKSLSQFYRKNELENSSESIKSELKKIISSIQDKIIKLDNENKIILKKIKFKSIIELYAESGEWDFWSIE